MTTARKWDTRAMGAGFSTHNSDRLGQGASVLAARMISERGSCWAIHAKKRINTRRSDEAIHTYGTDEFRQPFRQPFRFNRNDHEINCVCVNRFVSETKWKCLIIPFRLYWNETTKQSNDGSLTPLAKVRGNVIFFWYLIRSSWLCLLFRLAMCTSHFDACNVQVIWIFLLQSV
jgi:hypothetical protein